MTDAAYEATVRAFGAERHYSDAFVHRWLGLAHADGRALLSLAQELRLGEHQLRDLWEWADEIAARDALSLADVLGADAIAAVRRGRLGRQDKLKLIKHALRRARFPQLVATEARFAALVQELDLPHNVQLTWPEFPEGDAVHVEIAARDAAALRDALARLLAAAQMPACAAIFALLAEAP